ncbi:MAG: hypothetical protein K0R66_574 [Gammaproteobacteria bacterium]|jgi:hypothetical protein|nr:hypothetical protein [Gammaproteobacteria bacterium]
MGRLVKPKIDPSKRASFDFGMSLLNQEGPRKSLFRQQNFLQQVPELEHVTEPPKGCLQKICGCFFAPSLLEVIDPYLTTPIENIANLELAELYKKLRRVSNKDQYFSEVMETLVMEIEHGFDQKEILEMLAELNGGSPALMEAAINEWSSYFPEVNRQAIKEVLFLASRHKSRGASFELS